MSLRPQDSGLIGVSADSFHRRLVWLVAVVVAAFAFAAAAAAAASVAVGIAVVVVAGHEAPFASPGWHRYLSRYRTMTAGCGSDCDSGCAGAGDESSILTARQTRLALALPPSWATESVALLPS